MSLNRKVILCSVWQVTVIGQSVDIACPGAEHYTAERPIEAEWVATHWPFLHGKQTRVSTRRNQRDNERNTSLMGASLNV